MPDSPPPQRPTQKSLLRPRFIVWIAGMLLALSVASYLAARIAQLNQTISTLGDEDAIWSDGTTPLANEISLWGKLSLFAIPLGFLVYLCAVTWYLLRKRKGKAALETTLAPDPPLE